MASSSGGAPRDRSAHEPGGQGKPGHGKAGQGKPGQAGKTGQGKPTQGKPGQGGKPAKGGTGRAGQSRAGRRGKQAATRRRRIPTVDETSAGGLVVDTDTHRAAVIGRLDRRGRLLWSLPKGHIENGESAQQAAIREIGEETGILGEVIAPIGTIDYWFVVGERRVHKTVHHFLLRAVGGELSDADVEVTEVAWVPIDQLERRLAYADERRLVRKATELLTAGPG